MRIVFSTDWYSEGMGYSENVLPALLADRNHDVHVITSTMQVYGDSPFYHEVYGRYLGPPVVEPVRKTVGGVHFTRLPIVLWWKRFRIVRGRVREILRIKPDIVQTENPRSLQTLLLSIASRFSSFKLFTSEHSLASIYPAYYSFREWSLGRRMYLRLTETLWGWMACRRVSVCYATTPDAAEIAVQFHGVRRESVRHLPLGVDTRLFHPCRKEADDDERASVRQQHGVSPHEIVCIYTGRFTDAKNPRCLAEAVRRLRAQGRPFRAVFVGEGEQAKAIEETAGCHVQAFTPYLELGRLYRAADIGVWPCQESVGMLDAAACGLPIVVSDRVKAVERVDGNGLTYRENDPADLATQLARLEDPEVRGRLGRAGAERMRAQFSAERVVDTLLADYEAALAERRRT